MEVFQSHNYIKANFLPCHKIRQKTLNFQPLAQISMLITFCNLPIVLLLTGKSTLKAANGQTSEMLRMPVGLNGMVGIAQEFNGVQVLLVLPSTKVLNVENSILATVGTVVRLKYI